MDILYLLIPVSLLLIGGIMWAFFWAVRSGQFDDMEGPAHEILMDNDQAREADKLPAQAPTNGASKPTNPSRRNTI
jgi:cbb3-type cytochrome oxidase maturation protein